MTVDYYDMFSRACAAFYCGYGFLCCFVWRWWSKNVWFPAWHHDSDRVMEYMMIGAGMCCFVMTVLVNMLSKDVSLSKKQEHIEFQIKCWIGWTLVEIYYGCEGVEYPITACIHTVLCIGVLILALKARKQLLSIIKE